MKVLRNRLRFEAPSFIAPDPEIKKGLKKKLGAPMNLEVSPLEATYLLLVMLNQKALNDEFQQTPQEFAVRASRKASWLEANSGGPTVVVDHPLNIEKRRAVIRAATAGVAHMNTVDAINLTSDTLDNLGIEK